MKNIGNLFKKYGFYIATVVVCVGALMAIFLMPENDGNVRKEANPYAQNEMAEAKDLTELPAQEKDIMDEDQLDTTDETAKEPELEVSEGIQESEDTKRTATDDATHPDAENQVADKVDKVSREATSDAKADAHQTQTDIAEVPTETFKSTTAPNNEQPFFAEGDTFMWPVEGKVVVPYTDENTTHWFSKSLNQTMRTFGICIGAEVGTEVKALAKGTVTQIVEDSSTYLEAGMPYVGKLMVLDHGNGYISLYGFQGGEVNEDLVGKVVDAGDVLGNVGNPKGAFIDNGSNIYLQVMHNDKVVNPLNYLDTEKQEIKAESVDLGFAE